VTGPVYTPQPPRVLVASLLSGTSCARSHSCPRNLLDICPWMAAPDLREWEGQAVLRFRPRIVTRAFDFRRRPRTRRDRVSRARSGNISFGQALRYGDSGVPACEGARSNEIGMKRRRKPSSTSLPSHDKPVRWTVDEAIVCKRTKQNIGPEIVYRTAGRSEILRKASCQPQPAGSAES